MSWMQCEKKAFFVEDIYQSTDPNSRIYANDHLSPYFANLFQCAWKAKKAGSIFSASSLGGRIKIKKHENSMPCTIETETQLNDIIAGTEQMDTEIHHTTESLNSHTNNVSNQEKSPQSIDSTAARSIREKAFTHKRQPNHQMKNSQPGPSNRFSQRPNTSNQDRRNCYNQPQPTNVHQQQRQQPKRNNRHVNSLDYHQQQPMHKKTTYTSAPSTIGPPDYSQDHRRQYQNRLRSYVK